MSLDKRVGMGLLYLRAAAVITSYGLIAYESKEYNQARNLRSRRECVENVEIYLMAGISIGDLLSLAGLIILEETKKKGDDSSLMIKENEE